MRGVWGDSEAPTTRVLLRPTTRFVQWFGRRWALNSEGEEVLRQICRFATKQLGCEFSSYCGRAWARISGCLQRSVGQAILNRVDGREFRDPLTLSGPDSMTDLASCA